MSTGSNNKPLSVLIYLTGGDHWIGGIQYTRNLLRSIALLEKEERPRMILRLSEAHLKTGYQNEFSLIPGVRIDEESPLSKVRSWLWRMMGKKVKKTRIGDACDVAFPVKIPGLGAKPKPVHWIPDFQYKHYPNYFSDQEREKRNRMYDQMFAEGSLFIFSSQSTERNFRHFFPQASHIATRVMPFYSVFDESELKDNPSQITKKYNLPEKFLYAPNQFWQHKGHDTIMDALGILKKQGVEIPLVCTGSTADYRTDEYMRGLMEKIQHHELESQVKILGVLPRTEQLQIFRSAPVVVQASRFEGWSTVVEDARALGKSLVLSDIDVHLEQNPPHASFFKTGDAEDLAQKLQTAWANAHVGYCPDIETASVHEACNLAKEFARNFICIMNEAKNKLIAHA